MTHKYALLALFFSAFVVGCASTGSGGGREYSVGPGSTVRANEQVVSAPISSGLSVLVPVMDPNIPEDPDDYEDEGVWPELRRAEANRFTVQMNDALLETNAFESVRVSPDQSATAHLYVRGEILESNGEDIKIQVTVIDISGKKLLKKKYKHRVKEYDLEDPRSPGQDLYAPVFAEAAADIAEMARELDQDDKETLKIIEELRFAEAYSPEYFSGYISTSSSGRTKLVAQPSDEDPMFQRIRVLRVRDQMFIDNMQGDYERFSYQMDKDYLLWQQQAFYETKAAREARAAATTKFFLGALAVIGGAVLATNSDAGSIGELGGIVTAVGGAAAIYSGVESSRDAASHRESLSELGRSLNIKLAPRVMEFEGQTIELQGTASEQYQAWRAFLQDFYNKEQTPDVAL